MKGIVKVFVMIGLVGIFLTFWGARDTIKMSKEPINMNEADWGTLEAGDHVQITIDMVWGQVYTEQTEETTLGITTSSRESGRGYAIPHLYIDNQGYYNIDYYVGLRLANQNDYSKIESILRETRTWFESKGTVDYGMTTLYIDGTLEKMDSEEKEFMRDYLMECGYSSPEVTKMMCPYMITRGNMNAAKVSLGIGIVCDVILLIGIGLFFVQKKKEKELYAQSYSDLNFGGSTGTYGNSYGGSGSGYGVQEDDFEPWQPYQ